MTFEEWFNTLEGGYSAYEDLLRDCWEAAQKAKDKSWQ